MLVDQGYEEEDEEDMNAETVEIEVQRFMDKVLCERQAYVKVWLLSQWLQIFGTVELTVDFLQLKHPIDSQEIQLEESSALMRPVVVGGKRG